MHKPNFFPFQTLGLTLLLFLVITALYSQSPLGIPYQAVLRNADGSVMSNASVNMNFKIHDGSASGDVVYEESHALTSNAQGLVSCVVGNGIVSQGNFGNIPWGSGAKFLQVMMGTTELGTQQMMSVPYALYSNGVNVRVSSVGDTLFIGGQSVIVPGISAANVSNNGMPTSGLGAVVLLGNATCADQFISVSGCNGQTTLTYDGKTYDLVEIGGQCWFADNLATDQYRNGDLIPTGLDNDTWSATSAGAYAIYNEETYGKLYNWYTTIDDRGLCPTGWHVPSDCEWMYLENSIGMSVDYQMITGYRGNEGGVLKALNIWEAPNGGASNSTGFSALPGGYRSGNGSYWDVGSFGYWWTSTEAVPNTAWTHVLTYSGPYIIRGDYYEGSGFSIRCLKDSQEFMTLGCTDGSACNFSVGANQDDGSCLYQNATCDDGNVNTINDVIDGSCICVGSTVIYGCTDSQSCNFDALANTDDGSCLIIGANCDDGSAGTINDIINNSCQCAGTELINGLYIQGNGVIDVDGNFYPSIIINGQEWMQKNLAVSKYRDGSPIPTGLSNSAWSTTNSGAYAIYANDPANNSIYGKLYNFNAVLDSRGLCPIGWHVPSDGEWTTLEFYLGGSSLAGGKMKSSINWTLPNVGATNLSGFSALPGGYRNFDTSLYYQLGTGAFWWSSTTNLSSAWFRDVWYGNESVNRYSGLTRRYGYSIRCLKD